MPLARDPAVVVVATGDDERRFGIYLADLRRSNNESHGIINYALGLTTAIAHQLGDNERLHLLANSAIARELSLPLSSRVEVELVCEPTSVPSRLILDHIWSSAWTQRKKLHLVHFPKGHLPLLPLRGVTTVVSAHDDIALRYSRGDFGSASGETLKRKYIGWAFKRSLRKSHRIVTISQFSARRIASYHPDVSSRTSVTYLGLDLPRLRFVPLSERSAHIVVLGSTLLHKQTTLTLAMLRRYIESRPFLTVTVIGRIPNEAERVCASSHFLRHRDVLSSEDLANLIARSRALVFGSAYEGFGLPPVEAYALGTPAAYFSSTATAEIMSGLPGGYRTWTYSAFSQALDEVLRVPEAELRGNQTFMRDRYRWDVVGARTLAVYREATCSPSVS